MHPKIGEILTDDPGRDAIHIAVIPVVAADGVSPAEEVGFSRQGDGLTVTGKAAVKVGIVDPYLTRYVKKGQRFYLFLFPNTVTSLRHVWTHPAFDGGPQSDVRPAAPVATPPAFHPTRATERTWRSDETVRSLEAAIRATDRYDTSPVLADALEEAGYGDQQNLAALRKSHPPHRETDEGRCAFVAVFSTPTVAASVRWLTDFAAKFEMTYGRLYQIAVQYAKDGEVHCLPFNTPDEAFGQAAEMWQHLHVVAGPDLPLDDRGSDADETLFRDESIFRCAC